MNLFSRRIRQAAFLVAAIIIVVFVTLYQNCSKKTTSVILQAYLKQNSIKASNKANSSLVCMVLTTEANILTRGVAVFNTWGQQCDELVFACNCLQIMAVRTLISEKKDVPGDLEVYKKVAHLPVLHVDVIESREKMGEKVLPVLKHTYAVFQNLSSWYIMLDDDAYVFMDNLNKFIATKNPQEAFMYGFHFRHRPLPAGHIAGGSGILLTQESMKRLVNKINKNECNKHIDTFGDVTIGGCAYETGIQIANSTDELGRPRFHFHDPDTHFNGPVPEYLYSFGVHDKKIGKECCSLETISFHYVKVEKMYEIHSNKNYLRDLLS